MQDFALNILFSSVLFQRTNAFGDLVRDLTFNSIVTTVTTLIGYAFDFHQKIICPNTHPYGNVDLGKVSLI